MNRFTILLVLLLTSHKVLTAQDLLRLEEKVLVYEALFIETNGDTLTKEKIEFQFKSEPWIIKSQKEVVYTYFTDTIGIKNFSHPFEKVRKKNQKYQLKKEQGRAGWENWTWLEKNDVTGYILNDSVFWIHPPRTNQYLHNELAGMPKIELNELTVNGTWQSKLFIMMGWFDFKGTLESSYTVSGQASYQTKEISVSSAWNIEVNHSHSKLGTYKSNILFDEKRYGFLLFDNSFHDGRRIILNLIEVKNTPNN